MRRRTPYCMGNQNGEASDQGKPQECTLCGAAKMGHKKTNDRIGLPPDNIYNLYWLNDLEALIASHTGLSIEHDIGAMTLDEIKALYKRIIWKKQL